MIKKYLNCFFAIITSLTLLIVLSNSYGNLPALGKLLNPGSGIWVSAKEDLTSIHNQEISSKILNEEVNILFEKDGTPHILANNDEDGWRAIGYLHASNRLFQMDLMRRQGKGLLSEVIGESALEVDKFQRKLGITRTAKAEWQLLKQNVEVRKALEAYAAGVNEVIKEKINKDWNSIMARKTVLAIGMLFPLAIIPAIYTENAMTALAFISIAIGGESLAAGIFWATVSDVAPKGAEGRLAGLQSFVGNLAGWIAPVVTGLLVSQFNNFTIALIIPVVICGIASLGYIFLLKNERISIEMDVDKGHNVAS